MKAALLGDYLRGAGLEDQAALLRETDLFDDAYEARDAIRDIFGDAALAFMLGLRAGAEIATAQLNGGAP